MRFAKIHIKNLILTSVDKVQNYVILTGLSEQPDLRKGILKQGFKQRNTGWIFIIIGWMCTHTSNTHLCFTFTYVLQLEKLTLLNSRR